MIGYLDIALMVTHIIVQDDNFGFGKPLKKSPNKLANTHYTSLIGCPERPLIYMAEANRLLWRRSESHGM